MIVVIAILLILLAITCVKLHEAKQQKQQIIEVNQERQAINKELDVQIEAKKQQLTNIGSTIAAQNNILKSLKATEQELREGAQQRADQEYEARCKALSASYAQKEKQLQSQYDAQSSTTLAAIKEQEAQLKDLEAKQLAYLTAQKRQEEINSNSEYYQLCLGELEKNDIEMLRELQKRFSNKDSIDKLIWDSYYKPAYDALMSRLFKTQGKVCGIYKITDLTTNQAYIGQSVDIKERFRQHIKASLTYGQATNKLYQIMQKSGQYNLTFEVLEEVPRDKLNEREIYWIDFYKTKDFGLNSTRGGS